MPRPLLKPNAQNASIHELKEAARVGSSETSSRCTAIQMLIVGISRSQVCQALLVTNRALRKWIDAFNHSGVDGLVTMSAGMLTNLSTVLIKQAILDVINNPNQIQKKASIGMFF
jgi:hypothetical protein